MNKATTLFCLLLPVSLLAQNISFSIKMIFHPVLRPKHIYVFQSYERKIDTLAYPLNDTLLYTGTITKPGIFQIVKDSGVFQIWVDSIPMSFDVNEEKKGKYSKLTITNLNGSEDTRLLHQMTIPTSDTIRHSADLSSAYRDSLKNILTKNNTFFHNKAYRIIDSLFKTFPESPIIPFYISYYRTILSPDTIKTFYDRLPESSRNSEEGEDVRILLQRTTLLKKGSPFTDFTMKTSEGKKLSLHSVSAKYILLDFWASWCGPCRAENPHLLQLYDKYKGKGFEIIGISFDDSETKWLEAIRKDKLNWLHVSELKYRDNELAKKYYITGIPFLVLLDSNYKVAGIPYFVRDLDGILATLLGKN
ncbi:MAG TPA: TlpA disulfide reductase family protein [Chitinophagaceae bacterium]|nr:TlpA disulfide reductase family protein [Chitinophagaceae bacterium]